MGVIGHNGGPSVEPGASWRTYAWAAARAALLPTLPIEVVRLRVRRARDLGLDYKTYAGVRAASGHDVVAFLFSSNALRLVPARTKLGPVHVAKLLEIKDCSRIALVTAPLMPDAVLAANADRLDASHPAPFALARFADIKTALRAAMGTLPGDQVVLIGDHALEQDWRAAGRLAAYLPADRYFGHART